MADRLIPSIHVVSSPQDLAREAADLVVRLAAEAFDEDRDFSIALSGGSTPHALFQLLATEAYATRLAWKRVQVLFADERCVPAAHADSNFGAACRLLLDQVDLPYENIHRMAGEKDPAVAADEYDKLIAEQFDLGLDLVLLGMGDDGHTASLFPNTAALSAKGRRCVANEVPALGTWRLTLTAEYINLARQVVIMVAGQTKSRRVSEVLEGAYRPQNLPIQLIQPQSGQLMWLLDAAAAGMFDDDDQVEQQDD